MPSHTINFGSGVDGPQTDVGLDVGAHHAAWGGPPCTKNALIDTGSTATAISPAVRVAPKPMKIGCARINLPGVGIVWGDTYYLRIKLGSHAGAGRWFGMEVIEYQPSTPDVDILIGMDLLVRVNMIWDGPHGFLVLTC